MTHAEPFKRANHFNARLTRNLCSPVVPSGAVDGHLLEIALELLLVIGCEQVFAEEGGAVPAVSLDPFQHLLLRGAPIFTAVVLLVVTSYVLEAASFAVEGWPRKEHILLDEIGRAPRPHSSCAQVLASLKDDRLLVD